MFLTRQYPTSKVSVAATANQSSLCSTDSMSFGLVLSLSLSLASFGALLYEHYSAKNQQVTSYAHRHNNLGVLDKITQIPTNVSVAVTCRTSLCSTGCTVSTAFSHRVFRELSPRARIPNSLVFCSVTKYHIEEG
jgi:hypothetical protein